MTVAWFTLIFPSSMSLVIRQRLQLPTPTHIMTSNAVWPYCNLGLPSWKQGSEKSFLLPQEHSNTQKKIESGQIWYCENIFKKWELNFYSIFSWNKQNSFHGNIFATSPNTQLQVVFMENTRFIKFLFRMDLSWNGLCFHRLSVNKFCISTRIRPIFFQF